MTPKSNRQTGFTIIELMIAMAFIALLLLAIAAAIMQIGGIYNKGVTMKSVNQAGRVIVADMKRTIGGSQPFDVAAAYQPHSRGSDADGITEYDSGRLCTSAYSYIWNIGKYVNADDPSTQYNKYSGAESNKPLRFVKVRNNGTQYCGEGAAGPIAYADATEMLSEENLAVQRFHIERETNNLSLGMALYSIRIIISDAATEAIDTMDNECKPPEEDASYQNFCAVNEFSFTAQAGNKGEQ